MLGQYWPTLLQPCSLLRDQNCERLEKVQRAALKVLKPDLEYEERLECLHIPRLRTYPMLIF